MSIDHETTADDLDPIRNDDGTIDARHISSGNPNGSPPTVVPAAECREWQRRHIRGETSTEIHAATDVDVALSTVGYHVRDECVHDHEDD